MATKHWYKLGVDAHWNTADNWYTSASWQYGMTWPPGDAVVCAAPVHDQDYLVMHTDGTHVGPDNAPAVAAGAFHLLGYDTRDAMSTVSWGGTPPASGTSKFTIEAGGDLYIGNPSSGLCRWDGDGGSAGTCIVYTSNLMFGTIPDGSQVIGSGGYAIFAGTLNGGGVFSGTIGAGDPFAVIAVHGYLGAAAGPNKVLAWRSTGRLGLYIPAYEPAGLFPATVRNLTIDIYGTAYTDSTTSQVGLAPEDANCIIRPRTRAAKLIRYIQTVGGPYDARAMSLFDASAIARGVVPMRW
jgi:hypothetical protein